MSAEPKILTETLINQTEAGRRLGLNERAIAKLITEGKLRVAAYPIKIKRRIFESSVDQLVDQINGSK